MHFYVVFVGLPTQGIISWHNIVSINICEVQQIVIFWVKHTFEQNEKPSQIKLNNTEV